MSRLIVEVCRVEAVEPHLNADRMSLVHVKGWRVCAGRDQFAPGDLCVYVPPDAVLPPGLADRLGVTRYLVPLPKGGDGQRPLGGRVRVARLRGEPSYGLILPPDDPAWPPGLDVADVLGITKFEPPPDLVDGDGEPAHPAFHRYSDIENYRNFPDLIAEGEEVVLTEKLHGKNCRLGLVRVGDEWAFMAGSHNQRRKEVDAKGRRSQFWEVLTDPVRDLLRDAAREATAGVVLFGELFGAGVQDMWYGHANGRYSFRAFDVAVDGKYLGADEKVALCRRFGVEMVPVLYRGAFTRDVVEAHVTGPTTVCPPESAGRFSGREGVVITPACERAGEANGQPFDRVVLKAISFEYLERKGGTEFH